MDREDCSRREFLRTFAALSTAPVIASVLSTCAVYGANPPGEVTVNGMVFLDAQSNQVVLSGSQAVPVHASFVIQFNVTMNVASIAAAVTFLDSNNNPVAFAVSSDQNAAYSMNVTITPTADLVHNTNYMLSVNDTAADSYGTRLTVNANASAAFKTVA